MMSAGGLWWIVALITECKLSLSMSTKYQLKLAVEGNKDTAKKQQQRKNRARVTRLARPPFPWPPPSCLCKIMGWGRMRKSWCYTEQSPPLSLSCWQEHKGKIEFIVMSAVYLSPAAKQYSDYQVWWHSIYDENGGLYKSLLMTNSLLPVGNINLRTMRAMP